MLVLSRRTRDSIMIGHRIVVTVLSIGRDQVRLGIEAPADVEVHREEVYRSIQQANRLAAQSEGDVGQLAGVLPTVGGSASGGAARGPGGPVPAASVPGVTTAGATAPGAGAGPHGSERSESTTNGTATP